MNSKQVKILAALQAELAVAEATKDASLTDMSAEEVFYDACDRIRELNDQIAEASMPVCKGYRCPNTQALVAANID